MDNALSLIYPVNLIAIIIIILQVFDHKYSHMDNASSSSHRDTNHGSFVCTCMGLMYFYLGYSCC